MINQTPIVLRKGCYVELNDGRIRGPLTEQWKGGGPLPRYAPVFCHDEDLKRGWTARGKIVSNSVGSECDVKRIVPIDEAQQLASITEVRIPTSVSADQISILKRIGQAGTEILHAFDQFMASSQYSRPISLSSATAETIADALSIIMTNGIPLDKRMNGPRTMLITTANDLLKRFHIYERLPTDPPADENGSAIQAYENAQGGLSDIKQCSHPAAVHALIDED